MIVYRPIETNRLTQGFGESSACAKTNIDGTLHYPVSIREKSGGICPVGYKNLYPLIGLKAHNGYDLKSYWREPLYFSAYAETKWWMRTEVDDAGGVQVEVHSVDPVSFVSFPPEMSGHAKSYIKDGRIHVKFVFIHLHEVHMGDKPKIQTGIFADGSPQYAPEVKFGDLIGWCDSTGASSGDHAHWGMKFTNGKGITVGKDNGYNGAVSFEFAPIFVLELLGKKQELSASQRVAKLALNADMRTSDIIRAVAKLVYSYET